MNAETQLAAALAAAEWRMKAPDAEIGDDGATNDELAKAILAALAQHGLTVARSDDAEVGAALREAQEALPEGGSFDLSYEPWERDWQWIVTRFAPWPSASGLSDHHGPTIAAAARALTAELREDEK